jgi:ribosomal peptide maturation radical SAM protein 1
MASDYDATSAKVVLISMPWAPPAEPSLGLGILKAVLEQEQISCDVVHVAPLLLRWISIETFEFLAECWGISEFLFSGEIEGRCDDTQVERLIERSQHYIEAQRHPRYPTIDSLIELYMTVRHTVVPALLNEISTRILNQNPTMVGFSCMFDQSIASVALAIRLKQAKPELPIVFGGYAVAPPAGLELTNSFACIDLIVQGDGEAAIVEVARTAALGGVSAVRALGDKNRIFVAAKVEINNSPAPSYQDWFECLRVLAIDHKVTINTRVLPVEGSRGCWWGQNSHCIFCGIDEDSMRYRARDAKAMLKMLEEIRDRYGDFVFRFSDYIMPKKYYEELLPELAKKEPRFRLQGELKANHPPERVKLLADAGFFEVQPGIESFATPTLRIMKKGVRGIDNVSLLKQGYRNRIIVDYNILYGLPGESSSSYEEMISNIPKIYHLTPPISRNETVVTRYAPLQVEPERFGITMPPVHHPCYDVLFSRNFLYENKFNLDSYAYYFDRNFQYSDDLRHLYDCLIRQVDHWKKLHRSRSVTLCYQAMDGIIKVNDSRFTAGINFALSRCASIVYMHCDIAPIKIAKVAEVAGLTSELFEQALAELDEHRMIWREGDFVLGLAIEKTIAERHALTNWHQDWHSVFTA